MSKNALYSAIELASVRRPTEWHSPCRCFFANRMQITFIIPLLNFILPACDYSNFDRPELLKSSDVLDVTISDHYQVYVALNLKAPKQTPNHINTRSFKNYRAEQFSNDIAHIPWDTVDLMQSADGKLDAFNDLFLTCLSNHELSKTVK